MHGRLLHSGLPQGEKGMRKMRLVAGETGLYSLVCKM
jgi:hypothetical protein